MKKWITVVLSTALCLTCTACSGQTYVQKEKKNEYVENTSTPTAYYMDGSAFTPVLRFVVSADTHIGDYYTYAQAERRVENLFIDAYAYSRTQEYDKLDAFVVVGDYVELGTQQEYMDFSEAWQKNIKPETTFLCLQAGHELIQGSRDDHKIYTANDMGTHVKINGYHFITISNMRWLTDENGNQLWHKDAEGNLLFAVDEKGEPLLDEQGNYIPDPNGAYIPDPNGVTIYSEAPDPECDLKWIEASLKEAKEDTGDMKPIFSFHHHPITDTIIGSDSTGPVWNPAPVFEPLFENYTNLVDFCGHIHIPTMHPRAIMQDKYTTMNPGASLYSSWASDLPDLVNSISQGEGTSVSSGANIVEVDENGRMRILPYNVAMREFYNEIGTGKKDQQLIRYIECAGNTSTWLYTKDRNDTADLPTWSASASVQSVKFEEYGVWADFDKNSSGDEYQLRPRLELTFDVADDKDGIECYKVQVKNKATGQYVLFWHDKQKKDVDYTYVASEYYITPQPTRITVETLGISLESGYNLVNGEQYVLEITPIDAWHNVGTTPLSYPFTYTA